MAIAPFGDQFILEDTSVYGSRVSDFISRPVNYIMSGYKPGYALQASELNELQEQFFLQQTLTNRCLFNWVSNNKTPFGNGTTPYSPTNLSVIASGLNLIITASAGWYFVVDKTYSSNGIDVNSGIGFWCYLNQSINTTIAKSSVSTSQSSPTKIGLIYDITRITSLDDTTLNDNANANNVLMSIPGADRIKIENFSLEVYTNQTIFSDICTIYNTAGTYTANFLDGSIITTTG